MHSVSDPICFPGGEEGVVVNFSIYRESSFWGLRSCFWKYKNTSTELLGLQSFLLTRFCLTILANCYTILWQLDIKKKKTYQDYRWQKKNRQNAYHTIIANNLITKVTVVKTITPPNIYSFLQHIFNGHQPHVKGGVSGKKSYQTETQQPALGRWSLSSGLPPLPHLFLLPHLFYCSPMWETQHRSSICLEQISTELASSHRQSCSLGSWVAHASPPSLCPPRHSPPTTPHCSKWRWASAF